jgi:hypothetical protein
MYVLSVAYGVEVGVGLSRSRGIPREIFRQKQQSLHQPDGRRRAEALDI